MNVLLLGSDPRYEPILHGLTTVSGHRVKRRRDTGTDAAPISVDEFGALICAGPVRGVLNQIRQFLSDGKPVMVVPSAGQGSEAAYELLAVDEEAGGRLIAGFPHRYAGGWRELRERIQREAGEGLQLVQIERRLPKENGIVSREDVDELLMGDADLLRWLGTEYAEVTCLYTGATDAGVSRAAVTLAGDATEGTWFLETHADRHECRVTASSAGSSFSSSGPVGGSTNADECAAGMLADLERVLHGQPPQAAWPEAVRAFDVLDAARRSVKRRRTVEIASGEVSERGQFKTKMTALGCSLLSFTLFGVVLALLVGAVFDPRGAMERQSEAAGFVIEHDAFLPGTAELTEGGRRQLLDISRRQRETPAEIIVAPTSPATDDARRNAVVEFLRAEKQLELDGRVVVRPLSGRGFQRFMTGLWIVVFLPLGVFLILQALIVVTRSSN